MTNGDRIRTMTDEEMAVTIICPNEAFEADIECNHEDDKNCCACCLKWLQEEAANEG